MRRLYIGLVMLLFIVFVSGCFLSPEPHKPSTYTLTLEVAGEGSVTPAEGIHKFEENAVVELKAEPAVGWEFKKWIGDVTDKGDANTAVVMDNNKTVRAVFQEKEEPEKEEPDKEEPVIVFTLTIEVDGQGTVTPEVGSHSYEEGTVVDITATPAVGWEFKEWEGDVDDIESVETIVTMDEDKTVTVVFIQKEYSLTVTTEGEGTVDINPDLEVYVLGDIVGLIATPEEGWQFSKWQGDVEGIESVVEIVMDEDKKVTVVFEKKETLVSGIIQRDTTWNYSGSPYRLIDDIQISYGITLTIQPGVIINGAGNRLQTWGELNAVGTPEDQIMFNNVRIEPGISGSSSELFLINIQFAQIKSGTLYPPTGYGIYGGLIIRDSLIRETSSYTYLWYPRENIYIERNCFIDTGGISVGTRGDIIVNIKNNLFYNQQTDYAVKNWASYNTSKTVIEYNSFLSTDRVALKLPPGYSSAKITGEKNYWNTTDTKIIESMIYDKNNDLASAGYINYEPFLTSPHANTPRW